MDESQIVDFVLRGIGHVVSFVNGRSNYVPECDMEPESEQIVETEPEEHTIFISDKQNNVTSIPIPISLYEKLKDLKKSRDEKLITEEQFSESRQQLVDDFSKYFSKG